MVKGTNYIQLNNETVKLYVEEALNRRLGPGVNVKVTGIVDINQEVVGLLEFAVVEKRT